MDAGGSDAIAEALARLAREDAVGQLRRRDGEMARLGAEGETLKLDWVEAVPWLLAHPESLAEVEAEACALVARSVRHVIWAGMGGSVLTVRVLQALGYCDGPPTIYPLDSADPAALNTIVRGLAAAKGLALPSGDLLAQPDLLRALLDDVAMVAVAMGMTSEEPISHLAWLGEALATAGLPLADHMRVMALPGSLLEGYAFARDIPRAPLQLDGGSGTGGRMSAPGTRVFLLPVALWLAGQPSSLTPPPVGDGNWTLADILRRAWAAYDLDGAQTDPAGNRFARLAATLSAASVDGAVRLAIAAPGPWDTVRDWSEQLFEESLGKGGKGVVVFAKDSLPFPRGVGGEGAPTSAKGAVWLRITGDDAPADALGVFTLREPLIASSDAGERLAGLAALFLGLQLTTALYGYLHGITFAGQPAVENYKARARRLRDSGADVIPPLTTANSLTDGKLTVLFTEHIIAAAAEGGVHDVVGFTARAVAMLRTASRALPVPTLPYLDLTINGEAPPDALATVEVALRALAVERLGVPYKLRRAPAAYHSTEQSEMDGPTWLVSLRALALRHEQSLLGEYTPRFLQAQAVATWQAMTAARRPCLLLLYDGDTAEMLVALAQVLDEGARRVG